MAPVRADPAALRPYRGAGHALGPCIGSPGVWPRGGAPFKSVSRGRALVLIVESEPSVALHIADSFMIAGRSNGLGPLRHHGATGEH
jgi:hypothetical protein